MILQVMQLNRNASESTYVSTYVSGFYQRLTQLLKICRGKIQKNNNATPRLIEMISKIDIKGRNKANEVYNKGD